MPHLKQAKKRLRQSLSRKAQNRSIIKDLRTNIKKFRQAVDAGDQTQATETLKVVYQKLDKCGDRKYLHRNTADRYKSRLAKLYNKMDAKETTA